MKLLDILKGLIRDPFNGVIYEGLIKTTPIDQSLNILNRQLQNYPELDLVDDGNQLIVGFKPKYIDYKISNYSGQTYDPNISNLLKLLNNLGYLPSIIKYELNNKGEQYVKKYSPKELRRLIEEDEPTYLIFVFEPKYDPIVTPPEYIYHITSRKFLDNIKLIGLKPKTLNKRSTHPERVYFSLNKTSSNSLWKNMEYHYGKDDGILLTISTTNLNNIFYNDPNFTGKGIYTYGNIPPSNIIKYELI